MSRNARVGLDFGGVVVKPGNTRSGEDTAEATRGWEPQPGAIQAIGTLVEHFAGAVFVVSKASPRMEALTRAWLAASAFHAATGLDPAKVHFCRERPDKLRLCEWLSITHFVDDRTDVLKILRPGVPHLYRFATCDARDTTPDFATHVSSWGELLEHLVPGSP